MSCKRLHFEAAMATYDVVGLLINIRTKGVILPDCLPDGDTMSLSIEPHNPSNNQAMTTDADGFACILAFNGTPFLVVIPWRALESISTEDYMTIFPTRAEEPAPKTAPGLRLVE